MVLHFIDKLNEVYKMKQVGGLSSVKKLTVAYFLEKVL